MAQVANKSPESRKRGLQHRQGGPPWYRIASTAQLRGGAEIPVAGLAPDLCDLRRRAIPLLGTRTPRWTQRLRRNAADWHARLNADDDNAVIAELAHRTSEHLDTAILAGTDTPVRILRGDQSQRAFADAAQPAAALLPARD